jgi:hypothetical protein
MERIGKDSIALGHCRADDEIAGPSERIIEPLRATKRNHSHRPVASPISSGYHDAREIVDRQERVPGVISISLALLYIHPTGRFDVASCFVLCQRFSV